jgi:uncharacterized membrane protein
MQEKNLKYVQWLLYGLMGISALLTLVFYINPNPDLMLYWGYFLAILSIIIVLGISLMQILKNPKGSLKTLITVGVIVFLALISYAMSKNTLTPDQLERAKITANGVKMVSAGLIMTYLIMVIAIGVFIYTSLYKLFK